MHWHLQQRHPNPQEEILSGKIWDNRSGQNKTIWMADTSWASKTEASVAHEEAGQDIVAQVILDSKDKVEMAEGLELLVGDVAACAVHAVVVLDHVLPRDYTIRPPCRESWTCSERCSSSDNKPQRRCPRHGLVDIMKLIDRHFAQISCDHL